MVYISQSGQKLSNKAFLDYFEKKVRKTIRVWGLLGKKEKILVACSGGKDSTTALYLIKKIVAGNRNISVEAIHVDPSIGEYSKINRENIVRFCSENGIKLHLTSFREEFGYSLCYIKGLVKEYKSCRVCGILRRYILNKKAKEASATKIVTGHNLDDEAQNVIMNIFQNHVEILPRLGPMTAANRGFVQRIKPLYFCTEEEVKLFSKLNKFPVKYEKCPCRADAYRKDVCDMLNVFEKEHKSTKTAIIQSFLKLSPELKKINYGKAKACEKCGEPSSGHICGTCKLIEKIRST